MPESRNRVTIEITGNASSFIGAARKARDAIGAMADDARRKFSSGSLSAYKSSIRDVGREVQNLNRQIQSLSFARQARAIAGELDRVTHSMQASEARIKKIKDAAQAAVPQSAHNRAARVAAEEARLAGAVSIADSEKKIAREKELISYLARELDHAKTMHKTQIGIVQERKAEVAAAEKLNALDRASGQAASQEIQTRKTEVAIAERLNNLYRQIAISQNPQVTSATANLKMAQLAQAKQVAAQMQQMTNAARTNWQKFGQAAKVAGVVAVAAIVGVVAATRTAITILSRLGSLVARVVVGAFRTLAAVTRVAASALAAIGRAGAGIIGTMGRVVASVARAAAALVTLGRSTDSYRKVTGDTVDAEGWHSRSLKGLVGNVVNMNRWINTLGSGVRQLGQAFQNLGMTMSIFVSYPMGRLVGQIWDVATEWDSAMIEIRKNTNLTMEDVKGVSNDLMGVVQETSTASGDIAKIAIDLAKAGVQGDALAGATQAVDKLLVATDVTAEEGVDNMVRLISIFYDLSEAGGMSADEIIDKFNRVGSVINEIGQRAPIGESDILGAAMRAAPVGKLLGLNIQEVIALSAAVASSSASTERAGSQMSAALSALAKNAEDVAGALGLTDEAFQAAWGEDQVGTILMIASAIDKVPDALERARLNAALFGEVGGKATGIIGSTLNRTAEYIGVANDEFAKGISLQMEFSRAMDSVANQTGLLRNQFDVLFLTIAEAILPVVTQILSYLIPAMKMVVELFKNLDDSTKLWIVGIMLLLTVLGPLIWALGSLMFSVGILVTGMTALFTTFMQLVRVPLLIVGGILSIATSFWTIVAAAGAAALAFAGFHGALGSVGTAIGTFVANMATWGYNAMAAFAGGIISAASEVYNAVVDVLNDISALLRSFSPPKEGPLSEIDKWGANIATTFAESFQYADISGVYKFATYIGEALYGSISNLGVNALALFSDLQSEFAGMVESFGKAKGVDDVELFSKDALASLIELISGIQNGASNIGELFGNVAEFLGPYADEFRNLLDLQVAYNGELKKQEAIQTELDTLDKRTAANVKAIALDSTKSVAERVAGIRGAKRSGSARKAELEGSLAASQARSKQQQEQIAALKTVTDTFKKFMPDLAAAMDNMSGSLDNLADKLDKKEKDPKTDLIDNLVGDIQEELFPMYGEDIFKDADKLKSILGSAYDEYIAKGYSAEQATIATKNAAQELKDAFTEAYKAAHPEEEKGGAGGSGEKGGLAGSLADKVKTGLEGVTDAWKTGGAKTVEEMGAFLGKMKGKGEEIKGFLAGLFGQDSGVPAMPVGEAAREQWLADYGEQAKGFEAGKSIFDQVQAKLQKFSDAFKAAADGLNTFSNALIYLNGIATMAFVDSPWLAAMEGFYAATGQSTPILFRAGKAFGNFAQGVAAFANEMGRLFVGGNGDLMTKATAAITGFATAFGTMFTLKGGMNPATLAAMVPALTSIAGAAVMLAGLTFDKLPLLGGVLGMIAANAQQLLIAAGAIAEIAKSLMGLGNADVGKRLGELSAGMQPGALKQAIDQVLNLGNPNQPFGEQIVGYLVQSLASANWTFFGATLAGYINTALVGGGTGAGSGGVVGLLEGANLSGIFGGILSALSGFIGSLKTLDFGQRISDILGGIFNEITVDKLLPATDAVAGLAQGALSGGASGGLINAAQAIITAIVESLSKAFANPTFGTSMDALASNLLSSFAELPWGKAAAGLGDLVGAIVHALAVAPWGKASASFQELINEILKQLANPTLWKNAKTAIEGIAGAIADAITGANWGVLFNADTMGMIADAILGGLYNALTGRTKNAPVDGPKGEEVVGGGAGNLLNSPIVKIVAGYFTAVAATSVGKAAVGFAGKALLAKITGGVIAGATGAATATAATTAAAAATSTAATIAPASAAGTAGLFGTAAIGAGIGNLLSQKILSEAASANGMSSSESSLAAAQAAAGGTYLGDIEDITSTNVLGAIGQGLSDFGGFVKDRWNEIWGGGSKQDESSLGDSAAMASVDPSQMGIYSNTIGDAGIEVVVTDPVQIDPTSIKAQAVQQQSLLPGWLNNWGKPQSPTVSSVSNVSGSSSVVNNISGGAAGAFGLPAGTADGLGAGLSAGLGQYMLANSATFFQPILTGLTSWVIQSAPLIMASMAQLGTLMGVGLQVWAMEGFTVFGAILTALSLWLASNTTNLQNMAVVVAKIVTGGMAQQFAIPDYYDSIGTAFSKYVGTITKGSPVLQAADNLAEKIVNEINSGLMTRWGDVKDAIEALINKALANTSVGGDGGSVPPPPTGNALPPAKLPSGNALGLSDGVYGGVPGMFGGMISNYAAVGGVVNVNFSGDVIVDSKQRINQLADEVSRRISRNAALSR